MAIDAPPGARQGDVPVLVLGHGAGNDFRSAFLEYFAGALPRRGIAVVRFNFPYKERPGNRPPDRMDALADCFHDVLLAQAKRTGAPPGPLFVGGKSMGGRVAAALVRGGSVKPSGIVFLGFPLHKAGAPDVSRAEELRGLGRPVLFVQGTRDALCDLDRLRAARKDARVAGSLHVVDGGDHSFALPKSRAAEQAATLSGAADAVAAFVRKVLARGPEPR